MGGHDPYWRANTNTSFSPPSSNWDFRFESERLPYGSNGSIQLHGSSMSSHSKDSRSWVRSDCSYNHQYSTSDVAGLYVSSPSDISPAPHQWTPPTIGAHGIDDYEATARRDLVSGPFYTGSMEGTSAIVDSGGSTSSLSDGSGCEPIPKLRTHRNVPAHRSFMSKPIHPLSFPIENPSREASGVSVAGFSEIAVATPQRDAQRWSSASSSVDYADISEQLDSEISGQQCNPSEGVKCGLCERYLSQRSPWSSSQLVRSSDMPIAGVLSCRHVFHAECLDQTTPKSCRSEPPCPVCAKLEGSSPELRALSRLKTGFPRLRSYCEDGSPSALPWACGQVGDCVEGALHAPSRNTMFLLNKNRMKKNLSLKGNSSKAPRCKLRKNGSYSSQLYTEKEI